MCELVEVRKDDVFTNSKVIAEGTGNQHHAIQQIISKYSSDIEEFGILSFEMRVLPHENYKGSTREKIYYLNEEQGSTHSDKMYPTYTKLANSIVGDKRDDMTASELNTITLVESIIKQTIEIDMSMGMHYKDIYKDCKERIEQFGEITYLIA